MAKKHFLVLNLISQLGKLRLGEGKCLAQLAELGSGEVGTLFPSHAGYTLHEQKTLRL